MSDEFQGFSDDAVSFLGGLRANNNKTWFDKNRQGYDDHLMEPAKAFVEAAGQSLLTLSPGIQAEPRVNGSIFRINRDTRFSKDKTPYKDHLDFWFWDDVDRKQAVTGYFLRLTPDAVGVGVGAHGFDSDRLARYRELVLETRTSNTLVKAVTAVEKAGFTVKGEHFKRPPKGFEEPTDPTKARLLRFNALWTGDDFDHPASMSSKRFVSWCMTRWAKQQPLHDWLKKHLQ